VGIGGNMARPKKLIDKDQVSKLVKVGLFPEEIEYVLDTTVPMEFLTPIYLDIWPSYESFMAKARKRLDPDAHKKYKRSLQNLRQSIRIQIADMIARDMGRVEDLIGYEIADLYAHLSRLMPDGYSWQERSKWHVDHIVPRSAFKVSQVKECFALSNLRPIPAQENLRKGSKNA
jgi:hypothetical protein